MINPEELRARARELRIAASTTEFVDIHEERIEMATQLDQCADELVRFRRPSRVISVGEGTPND